MDRVLLLKFLLHHVDDYFYWNFGFTYEQSVFKLLYCCRLKGTINALDSEKDSLQCVVDDKTESLAALEDKINKKVKKTTPSGFELGMTTFVFLAVAFFCMQILNYM